MTKKSIIERRRENHLFYILIFISLIISNIGIIFFEDSRIMPNYFIGLILAFLITNTADLNLYKLMAFGLLIDLFIGQLLGQHGLIFIILYLLYFLINKILIIKTEMQSSSLSIFLISISFIIIWLTSQSHDIFRPPNLLLLQGILTFFIYLIFKTVINKFT
jgi:cell shape-determining protein MreD